MPTSFRNCLFFFTAAFLALSCGGDSTQKIAELEKLPPVEVFLQGVGLDVQRVAFNANGSRILTSGGKGTTVWDAHARKELKTVFAKEAYSMAASNSGRYLITFSPSDLGKIHVCDFVGSTLRSLQVIPEDQVSGGAWIAGISIADDEKHFSLETGQTIKVYDIETLEQIHEIPLKESHYLFSYRKQGLSFLPGSNQLLALSYDIGVAEPDVMEPDRVCQFSINVYDIDAMEPKVDFALKSTFIYSWSVSADGRTLALLFMNKHVQTINLANGARKDFTLTADDEIEAIGFENRNSLVLAGRSGVIGRLNLTNGQTNILATKVRDHFLAVSCNDLSVSNDGRTVAFCSAYQTLILYDVRKDEIAVLGDPADDILGTYYDAGGAFNVITPKSVNTQYGSNSVAREVTAQGLHSIFSDQVRIHDPRTGGTEIFDASIARTVIPDPREDDKYYAWFSRDARLAFYWKKTPEGQEPDRNLYVARRDEPNREPVRLEHSESYGINIRAFDQNRKALIAGFASDYLGIWDLETGRLLDTLTEQSGNAEAFEFIGQQQCLIGTRGNVTMYDLTNNSVVMKFTPTGYYGDNRDIRKIAFSPNKNIFATGDAWGLVTIWDRTKEHEVLSFQSHKDWVTSLAFSPDGKYIISGSRNGKSAVINDVATGKQLAQFVSFTDGEWILITPEGYFNASAGGARHLNVRMGTNVYSIDNFYERFFNPSYVAAVFEGTGRAAVADIRKGFALPPQVKITSPAPGAEFKSDGATLVVSANDMGGGIDEIRLYQNGKMVSDDQRGMKIVGSTGGATAESPKASNSTVAGPSYDATKSFEVTLLPGVNTFRAIAFNRERTESNPDEITVELKGAQAASDLYLFVIGINEYKNGKYNLNYGRADAIAFGKAVAARSRTIFRNVAQYELFDGEATRPAIEAVFQTIARDAKPQDAFVFYYAGHGVMSEGGAAGASDFFLIPTDVTQLYGDDAMLAAKAVSAAQLKTFCTTIRAQKQLVVLDACQSGGAVESFATRGASEERAIMQLARSAGTVLLASTSTEQFATEFSSLSHGVFTYALLQGLNGEADGGNPKDGKITVKELEAYLNDRVPELTKKYRGTAQYPNSYARGQDFPLGVR